MGLGARIVDKKGRVPHIAWRWDPETDILTGAVKRAAAKGASTSKSTRWSGGSASP